MPWGGGENANENNIGGYHLIWSRDLYQVATAFMALGDKAAAIRALDFLFKIQQKPDGSFPQNSYLDGKPFWGSLQLDEVAFPLILAYQLGRDDKATYENHVKKAADFIVKNGPQTPQERWEEEGGFSPSTIAAEIAGLVCAAEIARKNGDEASATIYLATADDWARNVERWTATTNGKYGDGNYYLRITQNGKPDAGEKIELNNGAGFFDEREIVDAGFLELVRLGIKSPDDPLIQKSLKVIDQIIKVNTPNGEGFYRYNHDGYGEMDDGRRWNFDGKYTGKGRLWALLSGERGQYELALHLSWLNAYNNRFSNRTNDGSPMKTPPAKPSID
ncbi:MAG: glycoside hydrolase family 15 protein, partial [Pyrinomonadaceae bacterium]